MGRFGYIALLAVLLAGCTPPPPVVDSREILWQRFGHHPLDELIMAWGTPAGETHLSNGSRMVTYRHATIYDAASPYERGVSCDVSFLAASPKFRIEDISMEGDAYECNLLAQGRLGIARNVYVPPPYPYPYGDPYFHHHPF